MADRMNSSGAASVASTPSDYFKLFEDVRPPSFPPMSAVGHQRWHICAGLTIGLAIWYLHWRWTSSLNPDALLFSVLVATAETALFVGTLLFFYDIWAEGDTPESPVPSTRSDAHLEGSGDITVDVFITTFDEDLETVKPSIEDAKALRTPNSVQVKIYLLDDGRRPEMCALAASQGIGYLTRETNFGFKAGNLQNALVKTRGDFVLICDADTRLFPEFLLRTLGYFQEANVAWVQTPHWFYDIPPGRTAGELIAQTVGPRWAPPLCRLLGRHRTMRIGRDPFKSDPTLFFDIIQRRRNRHGASFCCGAGSIHRREPLFEVALSIAKKKAEKFRANGQSNVFAGSLRTVGQEPFRFHVSEDLFTSVDLHRAGWSSVYHPEVLARMLSPWSPSAWSTQKLKYSGGTLDIGLIQGGFFRAGLSWKTRLHYLATLWSYLSVFWLPILLLAPVYSLLTGHSPLNAHSIVFFLHLIPVLLANEATMIFACKSYDTHGGRSQAVAALPIHMRALFQIARGMCPRFPTTPKKPGLRLDLRYAKPALVMIGIMLIAAMLGCFRTLTGHPGYTVSLLVVNLFWLLVNGLAFVHVIQFCAWRPDETLLAIKNEFGAAGHLAINEEVSL